MFFSLGLTNARRNLGRSLVAVFSMALAALILSSSLSLATGHPAGSYRTVRLFMGGEISIFGPRFALSQTDLEGRGASSALSHQVLGGDVRTDLIYLEPELYSDGYVGPAAGQATGAVSSPSGARLDMDALTQNTKNIAGVTGVHPVLIYPGLIEADIKTRTGTIRQTFATPLRGRDIASDRQNPGYKEFVTAGRGLEPSDDGQMVALADANRTDLGLPPLPPGAKVTVKLPKVRRGPDGAAVFDYTDYTTFELTVVGQYSMRTRAVIWKTVINGLETLEGEELAWTTPYLLIPEGTLRKLFAQLGGDGLAFPVFQAGLSVPDTTRLNVTLKAVRAVLPEHTAVGTAALLSKAQEAALPEPVKKAPLSTLGDPANQRVAGEAVDLGRLIPILVYLVAALLVAANMLVLVAQRRREIGVLKALGARGWDVATMVLTEIAAVASAGALLGFGIVRIAATWTMVTNRVPIAKIGLATLSDLGQVLGLTVGAALLFGLMPAVTLARLPAMEVLRNE